MNGEFQALDLSRLLGFKHVPAASDGGSLAESMDQMHNKIGLNESAFLTPEPGEPGTDVALAEEPPSETDAAAPEETGSQDA